MLRGKRAISSRIPTTMPIQKVIMGLGAGLALSGTAYLLLNEPKKESKSGPRSLPPVQVMIPLKKMEKILHQNEYSVTGAPSISRMDINSVASNSPCEDYHSEFAFGKGTLIGIYDGHGGPECGALVSKYLSTYIGYYISKPSKAGHSRKQHIVKSMEDAFLQLDNDIVNGSLRDFSSSSWNPFSSTFDYLTVLKALKSAASGSCALVAYVEDKDLYVASIGDCRAVLGRKYGNSMQAIELTKDQTGNSPTEFSRLCEEHPGEDATVVIRGRVLGGLMPTRAFGDARYKWPLQIQTTVIPAIYPTKKRGIPPNYLTPPYVTARPEITHYELDSNDKFMIMACDGLWDDLSSDKSIKIVSELKESKHSDNYATALIQAALSGTDQGGPLADYGRIQHHLSIQPPLCRRYRDDMTVNVVFFNEIEPKGQVGLQAVPAFIEPTAPRLNEWVRYLNERIHSRL